MISKILRIKFENETIEFRYSVILIFAIFKFRNIGRSKFLPPPGYKIRNVMFIFKSF